MYASDNVHKDAGNEYVQRGQCAIFPLKRIPGDSIRLSFELNPVQAKKRGFIQKRRHDQKRGTLIAHCHVILLMQQ